VYTIVIVGGITRLTESGLSIVDWRPVTGVLPPMSEDEWEEEFSKYKMYPEFLRLKSKLTLEEFKTIFYWEWGHRILARGLGVLFAFPLAYFLNRDMIPPRLRIPLILICGGIGAQGLLGWLMVKSGLMEPENNSQPRVSHYRLAAHLGAALGLYSAMLWYGVELISTPGKIDTTMTLQTLRRVKACSVLTLALAATTIFSGALVAGRDAGLIYNSWPKMGDVWVPDEILELSPAWRNFFENDTTIQFNHRNLGLLTLASATLLAGVGSRAGLHKGGRVVLFHVAGFAWMQVGLGIATLVHYVPVYLGAMHQAGAVAVLSASLLLLKELRRIRVPL